MRPTLKQLLLRQLVKVAKTALGPRVPLSMQRAFIESSARINPLPRGAEVSSMSLGGVRAERVVAASRDGGRAVLYLHGGAFCIGSPRTHRAIAAHLARRVRGPVFVIDYRLAPEYPHPAPVDDSVTAWRALLELGHAPERLAIAGDSAGGALTVLTAVALRERGLPLPARLATLSPWTDYTMSGPSHRSHAGVDPMLRRSWLEQALGWHRPGASPLEVDLRGLPPLLIHVGSDEILLSDSHQLAARAQAAGVDVTLRCFEGMWHVFHMHAGALPVAGEAISDIGAFLNN
jgi:acetyl esterase/lipase